MAWIITNEGFYSIVTHPTNKKLLQVRARRAGDIEKLFPEAEVIEIDGRDYSFRAYLGRKEVGRAFGEVLGDISYPNFKDSIKDKALKAACNAVWGIMAKLQVRRPYDWTERRLPAYQRDMLDSVKSRGIGATPKGAGKATEQRAWPFPSKS